MGQKKDDSFEEFLCILSLEVCDFQTADIHLGDAWRVEV